MGDLEERSRKRRKKENIQRAVLTALSTVGILAVAAVAPNVFQALPHLMGKQRYKLAFQAKTTASRLAIKGHVRFVEKNGKKMMEITEAGRRWLEIERARASTPASAKKRWDKRYRLVMFDIPQRRRRARDKLRLIMRDVGFLRLQDSVWITPYDCEDLIALVKSELRVGKDILYAVVDQIENDAWIRKHFGLS